MKAGRLRHQIIIQSVVESKDTFGGVDKVWSEFATVRAEIKPLAGREYFANEQNNSTISHKVVIRYLSGVTSKMRILFGARVFEIVSPPINFEEKNIEMQIMCREII